MPEKDVPGIKGNFYRFFRGVKQLEVHRAVHSGVSETEAGLNSWDKNVQLQVRSSQTSVKLRSINLTYLYVLDIKHSAVGAHNVHTARFYLHAHENSEVEICPPLSEYIRIKTNFSHNVRGYILYLNI